MRIILILWSVILLLQPWSLYAAETQPDAKGALALEVFQMTQSLDELIRLLKSEQTRDEEYQKLQSAISYLSFRSRSIEMLQYDLRFKRERQDALETNIERTQDKIDNWDKDAEFLQSNNPNKANIDIRTLEDRLKRMREGRENLNTEIIKLENEIQSAKSDLSSFETYVLERLNLID